MQQSSSRRGNALVLAVGVMAIVAAVMVATTDSAVVAVKESKRDLDHQRMISAVGATLVRREKLLVQAAGLGSEGFVRRFDPNYTYDFATVGFVGQENYGVDWIGDVQVTWKIEPTRTREGDLWRQNPRPDGEEAALEMANTFLFKLSAEARLNHGDGQARARVQGVRYTSVNKEPLFRYIIFYSQEGARGDIEFNHSAAFTARGSVHTNGAIYLGSRAVVNDWDALFGDASLGATQLGPDAQGRVVMVNAADGIFRLSKHTLYGIANGVPMANETRIPPAYAPNQWYDTSTSVLYPGETGAAAHYRVSGGPTLAAATYGGREINPHRVKDGYGLATVKGTNEATDTKRTINGIPVRGVDDGGFRANDSRDRHRQASGSLVWASDSLRPGPFGFDKKARTFDNGGRMVRLPAIMANRPLEAQRIRYEDVDGDPTTDHHEYARPLFIVNGAETANHPPASGPVVESPGNYLGYALGGNDLAMVRVNRQGTVTQQAIGGGYNAWTVTTKSGSGTIADPTAMGLIIRERMMPDLAYLSGSAAVPSSPHYIPYAYGKHLRSNKMPFWPVDVSAYTGHDGEAGLWGFAGDRVSNGTQPTDNLDWDYMNTTPRTAPANLANAAQDSGNPIGFFKHAYLDSILRRHGRTGNLPADQAPAAINAALQAQTYAEGGLLTAQAAVAESLSDWYHVRSNISRAPRYYRSNWRLFHMQRPKPDTTRQGLTATYYDDYSTTRPELTNRSGVVAGWTGPFGGRPVLTRLDTDGVNETTAGTDVILAPTTVRSEGGGSGRGTYSVRWTGFIRPRFTESYTFRLTTDDGGRLWVNDVRMADRWLMQGEVTGGNDGGVRTSIELERDQWYPIVVEMFDANGGDSCRLEWESTSQAREVIPASRCAPFAGSAGGGIPRSEWRSLTAKVTPRTNLPGQKLGIMVRPSATRALPAASINAVTIVREAENHSGAPTNPAAGTLPPAAWTVTTAAGLPAASGGLAMHLPDPTPAVIGDSNNNLLNYSVGSRLAYPITFPAAGRYFLWLRLLPSAAGAGAADNDSVHVTYSVSGGPELPLGNSAGVTESRFGGFQDGTGPVNNTWGWISRNMTLPSGSACIDIPTPGVHTVYIYGREDDCYIDKFILTTQAGASFPLADGTTATVAGNGAMTVGGVASNGGVQGTYNPATSGSATLVPGIAYLEQGQDPYLMLGYSATRGVFAEFRRDRGATGWFTPPRYFVGHGIDSLGNWSGDTGELGADPVSITRVGTLTPSLVGTQVNVASIERDPGKVRTGTPPGTVTFGVPGDGTAFISNVRRGPWASQTRYTPTISAEYTSSVTWRFDLGNTATPATQRFLAEDYSFGTNGRDVRFYRDPTGNDQSASGAWTGNPQVINLSQDRRPSVNLVPGNLTAGRFTAFDVTWRNPQQGLQDFPWADPARFPTSGPVVTVLDSWGNLIAANVATTLTTDNATYVELAATIGNANTYWYDRSSKPLLNGTPMEYGVFIDEITRRDPLAQFVQVERVNSGSSPELELGTSIHRTDDPTPISVPVPAGWQNGTTPRTFSVNRTARIDVDVNSQVAAWAAPFASAVAQTLPWSSLWSTQVAIPRTTSFRPDAWSHRRSGTYNLAFTPRRVGVDGETAATDPIDGMTGSPRWLSDQPATWPPAGGAPSAVWLRIERSAADIATLAYAFTAGTPAAGDWQPVVDRAGQPVAWSIANWSPDLLMGPCMQSGGRDAAAVAEFSELSIEYATAQGASETASTVAPATRLDAQDWDAAAASGVTDLQRYMAGQYQVFFGPYEITEDFMTWRDPASGNPLVSETWIYNLREFWSQSRWWNKRTLEKDPHPTLPGQQRLPDGSVLSARELLARSTVLSLDMTAIQAYMRQRALSDAVADRIPDAGPAAISAGGSPASLLAARFNGVFFTARTNRYPWNPNTRGENPWNVALPNTTSVGGFDYDALMALAPAARATQFQAMQTVQVDANQTALHSAGALAPALQPYGSTLAGGQAPAFKPQQFHHAVRLINSQAIDWAFDGMSTPDFGTGKTAIVTPNPIYLQGNVNTVKPTVRRNGTNSPEIVPLALMSDQITVLSALWDDAAAKRPGLVATDVGLQSTGLVEGSLSRGAVSGAGVPQASDTAVVGALVTHNQPTTRAGVIAGESASIITTVLFQEDWYGRTFDYTGSLVVMDTRRYSESFLLDSDKVYGPSPFGFMGSRWRTAFGQTNPLEEWNGRMPQAYYVPNRVFTFNSDFLTPQGTPPFAPFGTSARGVGGWINIVQ